MSRSPDKTAVLDEKDAGASRIVFCHEEGEDQGPPPQEPSTSGTVVGGGERKTGPTSEFSWSLLSQPMFIRSLRLFS